jgi:hypothetical protein
MQALTDAERFPEENPGIYASTCGIVFLGTPFRGAFGVTINELLRAIDAAHRDSLQGEILRILDSGDEKLLEMVSLFEKVQAKLQPRARIACFFEQKPSNVNAIVGKEGEKVIQSRIKSLHDLMSIVFCCYRKLRVS